jgi:nitrite reductase/ring-hydroxylating ferredoxin subunit
VSELEGRGVAWTEERGTSDEGKRLKAPRKRAETARELPGPTGLAGPLVPLVPLVPPDGRTQWTFEHDGRSYAVFTVDGELHVTDGACPHNGGPLAEGLVRDGVVTCPWHWYSYELATGRCRTAAGYELRRYPVVLIGGRPHAAIPAPEPPRSWSQILRAHARQAGPQDSGGPGA